MSRRLPMLAHTKIEAQRHVFVKGYWRALRRQILSLDLVFIIRVPGRKVDGARVAVQVHDNDASNSHAINVKEGLSMLRTGRRIS